MGIGARVIATMKNQTDDAQANAILDTGLTSLSDLASWYPIIVVAVAGTLSKVIFTGPAIVAISVAPVLT